MSDIKESPDYAVYQEVMDCVGRYMAQTGCRHERYEQFPYPQRLGELSDLVRKHVLREEGNIEKYLQLEKAIDNLPLINGHPARQPSKFDTTIIKMAQWLKDSIEHTIPLPQDNLRENVVISLVVWGKYVEKLLNYTFKSLMAEGNLPFLAKSRRVIFYIQTDAATKHVIEKSGVTKKIKALGIDFDYAIIPDDIIGGTTSDIATYWLLGGATSLGIQYARKSLAAFHHSYPDMIYSEKFFAEIMRISHEHNSILAPGHRSDESMLLPHIKEYEKNEIISIPAEDLTAHWLNSIHVNGWSCMVNNRPKNWFYPHKHSLIWEGENLLYFNCPHANALWFSYSVIKDIPPRYFMTIDSELDLICKGGDFYIPQDTDDLYMAEFSNQSRSYVDDLWVKAEMYSTYMWGIITHRDSLKFFIRGMKMKINRNIRPLPENHRLFDAQIEVERAFLSNVIISNDMYEGIIIGRPRWTDGRIFKI